MGFVLSWLAVRGKSPEVVRSQLGYRGTGRRYESFTDVRPSAPGEEVVTGAELPGGWYLLVEDRGITFGDMDDTLGRLSESCEVLSCLVDERSMMCVSASWSQGRKVWSLSRVPRAKGSDPGLEIEGWLPPVFTELRRKALAAEAAQELAEKEGGGRPRGRVDYLFDVPAGVASSLSGFRYDEARSRAGEKPFEVLEEQDRTAELPPPRSEPSELPKAPLFGEIKQQSVAWVAVRGKSMEEVLRELGVRGTGRGHRDFFHGPFLPGPLSRESYVPRAPLGGPLPGDWYLVVFPEQGLYFEDRLTDERLARLSAGCEVVTCGLSELVNLSTTALWVRGSKVWSVKHEGPLDIEADGDLPATYEAALEKAEGADDLRDAYADGHFYIAVDLAESICGFRHDRGVPGYADFETLEDA